MTWIVTCPNWQSQKHKNSVHSWSLVTDELATIGQDYFSPLIDCKVCHDVFSLQQGVKESFSIDNPFAIHDFQFNAQERGKIELRVGKLEKIEFQKPFENKPEIYLTPYLKPVRAVPGYISTDSFCIFSTCSGAEGEVREIGWLAYGNRKQNGIPIWRALLSSSKEYQLNKDFRTEVVYLESAFEVFVSEYIGDRLKPKLRAETIDWLLGHGITEVLRAGFKEITGKPLSKLEPKAYKNWEKNVRDVRNNVIHRGKTVDNDSARKAREAVFEIITRIEPRVLFDFMINILNYEVKAPFGRPTMTL